jgi:hypothetical protein
MNIKSLVAGVALVALASPALAVNTITLPNLTVPAVGQASVSGSSPQVKGNFDEIFKVKIIGSFSKLTASVTAAGLATGTWDLYLGVAPGILLDSSTTFNFAGSTFGSVEDTSGGAGGFYYAELKGHSSRYVAPAVSFTAVTAVPELSTWGMMLAGFGALAFAGYRRRPVAA